MLIVTVIQGQNKEIDLLLKSYVKIKRRVRLPEKIYMVVAKTQMW